MKTTKQEQLWAQIYKDSFVNEALSPAEILAKTKAVAAARNKELADLDSTKTAQQIKQIWVKSIIADSKDVGNSEAELEITYIDGSVDNTTAKLNAGPTDGSYEQRDNLAKMIKNNLRLAGKDATWTDIALAELRVGYADRRIKWLYGPRKQDDSIWAFEKEAKKIAEGPVGKKIRLRKAKVDMDPNDILSKYRAYGHDNVRYSVDPKYIRQ